MTIKSLIERWGACLKKKARIFKNDQAGSVFAYFAFGMIPLIGLCGVAVDSARGYMLRGHLSESLDAAALAGGRAINEVDIQNDVTRFFNLNFKSSYMNATVNGPNVVYDSEKNEIFVQASATIDTSFMKILGEQSMTVSAKTKIKRNVRGMELVLVMDNTGSMRSGGKMDTMKSSAQDLINILYGERDTIDNFWVGLVPYSASVNIGAQNYTWLTSSNFAAYAPSTWKGCVEARAASSQDTNDDPPNLGLFVPYLYPYASDNVWPPLREGNHWQDDGTGPNLGCGPAITPLSQNKSTIQASIDEMQPWHRGGTLGNLGLVWGWRVLSPRWRNWWPNVSSELPQDYNTPLMDKVVIMLTDGVNQFFDYQGNGPAGSDYTSYGRRDWGRLGVTGNNAATNEVNNRMAATCTAMKQEGIIIYTITFQLSNATTQNLYRNCATSPRHYFNSPSNSDLQTVFKKIGNELSNLRITE